MENIKTITKFELDDKTLYVKVLWKPNTSDLFNIKIYDRDKSWSGDFSYETAHEFRDNFDETEDEYVENVKKAFLKHQDFSYSFDLENPTSAKFKWKKRFEDIEAVVNHGVVLVQKDEEAESKDSLIDDLLSENDNLKQSIDKINTMNKELTIDVDKYKNSLNEFKDIKTNLEASLYGKFVQVLNAKKRRIQLLEENLVKISKLNGVSDEID